MNPSTPVDDQKMQSDLEQVQHNTILFSLLGLFIAALILGSVISYDAHYEWAMGIAIGVLVLIPLVWFLSAKSLLWASIALISGVFAMVLLTVLWGNVVPAVSLLFLPVGIASLTLGVFAGCLAALVGSLLLFAGPAAFQAIPLDTRVITVIGIWSVVGMIWVTLKPLLTAVNWAWKAYQQNYDLLSQSRSYQEKLHTALEDLTNANTQLNRLNALANNLRQIAENERRIKAQFVANVSHELRTPLNMIIGFSEMILKSPESYGEKVPTKLLSDLQVVLRNSQHLSCLIDDVLDLSQIEANQMALVKEWVQVPEIIEAVIIAVQPLYKSRNLYLSTEAQETLPPIFCDRTRIREVLLNLLSNAGRFTETGGVTVRVSQENNNLLFNVSDTGPGITEEDQNRLFQPFQQLDSSIRRRHGGTGLGLSISKSFIELHDGKMWVESEKGVGTSFYFHLPVEPFTALPSPVTRWINPYIAQQVIEKPPRAASVPLVDTRPRLLVIEKGAVLQRLLRRYLPNVEISAVIDLDTAHFEFERAPARMVLINDLELSNSVENVVTLAWLPLNIPVISCSIAEAIQYAPGPDISEILVKPISRDALLGAVEKLGHPIKTILIVDDEEDAQKLFMRMLSSANRGYRVFRAGNGLQALELLSRKKVDVIFLDMVMPEMDGYQFLKLKEQNSDLKEIPVILISACDTRGQPIVSNYLAATRSGGLSVQQLLNCIQALSAVLAPNSLPDASGVDQLRKGL